MFGACASQGAMRVPKIHDGERKAEQAMWIVLQVDRVLLQRDAIVGHAEANRVYICVHACN